MQNEMGTTIMGYIKLASKLLVFAGLGGIVLFQGAPYLFAVALTSLIEQQPLLRHNNGNFDPALIWIIGYMSYSQKVGNKLTVSATAPGHVTCTAISEVGAVLGFGNI